MASAAGAVVSWRSVVAAALSSVLLGLVLAGNAHAALAPDGALAGESGEGHFGQSVALSADGNTALVGAPSAGGEAGAVLVFTRTGSTWTQQAELSPNSGKRSATADSAPASPFPRKGTRRSSVAPATTKTPAPRGCSSARKTVPGSSRAESSPAAARRRRRSSAGASRCPRTATPRSSAALRRRQRWRGVGVHALGRNLDPAGREADRAAGERHRRVRRSVALSADGDTALIGGSDDNGYAGAAWVFTRSGGHLDPAGRKADRQRRERPKASSAAAWRCPPTATRR